MVDGQVDAQKQLPCSFVLEVMSATFNLPTPLFGIFSPRAAVDILAGLCLVSDL